MRTNLAVAEPFHWPTAEEAADYLELADTKEFAAWLWHIGEHEISKRTLEVLYSEFCVHARRSPLKAGQLQRQLRNAGVVAMKGRETRTMYRVLARAS